MEKRTETITSLGDVEKLIVQKSKPLFALWQSDLTLAEFKILDVYLGRINSHDEEHRTVKFEKKELEGLLGVKEIKPEVLDDRLKHLMTSVKLPDDKNGFTRISIFEKAYVEIDEYGLWQVELTCTPSAKQFIFNIEDLQYLRYKLRNIIHLKSRYSYIMFLYILNERYRGTWKISLDDLRLLLCCNNESYNKFKVFNDQVLKRVQEEIHRVTDLRYTYETVKKGRTVVGIKFCCNSKKDEDKFMMLFENYESLLEDL